MKNFQNDDFFPNASIDFTNQFQADYAPHKNDFVKNDLSPRFRYFEMIVILRIKY